MDRCRGDASSPEALGNTIRPVLGAGENKHHREMIMLEEMQEQGGLEIGGNLIHRLRDGVGWIGAASDLHGLRILEELPCELLDLTGESG